MRARGERLTSTSGSVKTSSTNSGDEEVIEQTRLTNANGVRVDTINFGAIITGIWVPDIAGRFDNVVLGYDDHRAYRPCPFYMGAVIGRHAGRIAHGRARLGDRDLHFPRNAGDHHIHGGAQGFHKKFWRRDRARGASDGQSVTYALVSPGGENGYPGAVTARVKYTLTDADELIVDYSAHTSADTFVNLTQHSYFNLSGDALPNIQDHELVVAAQEVLEIDSDGIPTGRKRPVEGGDFDFQRSRRIDAMAHRLDHDYLLTAEEGECKWAGAVRYVPSGRKIEIYTDQPALHVYAGANLTGARAGGFPPCSGICLEAQGLPDAPNHPTFPSALLKAGDTYQRRTIFAFSTEG